MNNRNYRGIYEDSIVGGLNVRTMDYTGMIVRIHSATRA